MSEQRLGYGAPYEGLITVHLKAGVVERVYPNGVTRVGDTVTIEGGSVTQVKGGLQFQSQDNTPFAWGYKWIEEVRGSQGELLWKNSQS